MGEEVLADNHDLTKNMELIETESDGTQRFKTANGVYRVRKTEHGRDMSLED